VTLLRKPTPAQICVSSSCFDLLFILENPTFIVTLTQTYLLSSYSLSNFICHSTWSHRSKNPKLVRLGAKCAMLLNFEARFPKHPTKSPSTFLFTQFSRPYPIAPLYQHIFVRKVLHIINRNNAKIVKQKKKKKQFQLLPFLHDSPSVIERLANGLSPLSQQPLNQHIQGLLQRLDLSEILEARKSKL
jgi:hypothetical protein